MLYLLAIPAFVFLPIAFVVCDYIIAEIDRTAH